MVELAAWRAADRHFRAIGPPSSMIVSLSEVSVQSRTSMEKKDIYGSGGGWVERPRNPSRTCGSAMGFGRAEQPSTQPTIEDIYGEKVIYGRDVGWVERQRNPSWPLRLCDGFRPGREPGLQPILRTEGHLSRKGHLWRYEKPAYDRASFRRFAQRTSMEKKVIYVRVTGEKGQFINDLLIDDVAVVRVSAATRATSRRHQW